MIAASVYTNPAVIGLLVSIPSAALGYLGYKRSQHVDTIAERAGLASAASGTIGQIIDGLNKIVVNLQADNEALRATIHELSAKLFTINQQCDVLSAQCVDLKRQITDLGNQVAT